MEVCWCRFEIALGSEPRVGRFSTRFSLLRRGRAGCWKLLRRVGHGSRPCSSGAVMRSSLVDSGSCAQKLNINFVRMSSLCEWVRRTRFRSDVGFALVCLVLGVASRLHLAFVNRVGRACVGSQNPGAFRCWDSKPNRVVIEILGSSFCRLAGMMRRA